jgi:hypothetical protein
VFENMPQQFVCNSFPGPCPIPVPHTHLHEPEKTVVATAYCVICVYCKERAQHHTGGRHAASQRGREHAASGNKQPSKWRHTLQQGGGGSGVPGSPRTLSTCLLSKKYRVPKGRIRSAATTSAGHTPTEMQRMVVRSFRRLFYFPDLGSLQAILFVSQTFLDERRVSRLLVAASCCPCARVQAALPLFGG